MPQPLKDMIEESTGRNIVDALDHAQAVLACLYVCGHINDNSTYNQIVTALIAQANRADDARRARRKTK